MWNVLYYNSNKKAIESYDVVNEQFLIELKQKHPTFDKFDKALKSEMKYRYWCRCEWELVIYKEGDSILIKPWIGNKNAKLDITNNTGSEFYSWLCDKYHNIDGEIRFDVFDQLLFAWDKFSHYCWEVATDD